MDKKNVMKAMSLCGTGSETCTGCPYYGMNGCDTNLPEYAERLKANGNYKDFGTRLAWDCIHATIPSEIVCGWYDKYNCHDDHITTAAKAALREMGVL